MLVMDSFLGGNSPSAVVVVKYVQVCKGLLWVVPREGGQPKVWFGNLLGVFGNFIMRLFVAR